MFPVSLVRNALADTMSQISKSLSLSLSLSLYIYIYTHTHTYAL